MRSKANQVETKSEIQEINALAQTAAIRTASDVAWKCSVAIYAA